jgi:methyltransferase (TIGR00027 family)
MIHRAGTIMLSQQTIPTLLGAAIRRAQHQLLDAPLILRDPVAVLLAPEAEEPGVLPEFGTSSEPIPTLFRAMFAMRSRFAEDRLADAAQRGVRQYVMIGAGLDTFPWRQPDFARDMRIFAADHPASLRWTARRLQDRGLAQPANLTRVPIDLREGRLADQLAAGGVNLDEPCFCSVLGVTQYLDGPAIKALFRFAGALGRGSETVLSFIPPDGEIDGIDLEIVSRTMMRADRIGEPWVTRLRPHDLLVELNRNGFTDVFHLTPELAQRRYFAGRQDGLRAPRWEHLIAAMT